MQFVTHISIHPDPSLHAMVAFGPHGPCRSSSLAVSAKSAKVHPMVS